MCVHSYIHISRCFIPLTLTLQMWPRYSEDVPIYQKLSSSARLRRDRIYYFSHICGWQQVKIILLQSYLRVYIISNLSPTQAKVHFIFSIVQVHYFLLQFWTRTKRMHQIAWRHPILNSWNATISVRLLNSAENTLLSHAFNMHQE